MSKLRTVERVFLLVAVLLLGGPVAAQHAITSRATERLQRAVRHELITLPYYSVFDNLEYQIRGYDVTLQGQVTRPTLKSDAERVVKEIEGVERVINRIEVLPLSPSDDRIRRAEFFTLFSDRTPLFRYGWGPNPPIHIIVKAGHVTLVGVVASPRDRDVAGLLAKQVSGVFSVTNKLKVETS
jgi:osmotically-inducible protein OsmY